MTEDEETDPDAELEDVKGLIASLVIKGIARSMVIQGEVDLDAVSGQDLLDLAKRRLVELVRSGDVDFTMILDHTENILTDARTHAENGKDEYAFVFYALYYEHILNRAIRERAIQLDLSEKEGLELMRRGMPEKLGLTWKLLFGAKFPEELRADILATSRRRNSFIHYKWHADPTLESNLEAEEARRSKSLAAAERAAVDLTDHLNRLLVSPDGDIGKWLHSSRLTPDPDSESDGREID
ncbi:hypothetical protein C5E06_09480 [Pseudoclavibacter sp. RFBI5]|uniref:hypothetical protein n=1 Tax=Pseudoclavibacter sp. RFBI5 TaxID=2080578 RepID=UPI000CE867FF|nr:hypothetical protein [Pseudoclavibacter sp. RFBI5]PPG02674.1 hypothetical protein C5E06_09480 [Pseudoclavibacter sp. RFBI5]